MYCNKMPSQKNSGNRGSQGESPILKKNNAFFDAYINDIRKEGSVNDVYVGRILRKMGNGRMEVFYVKNGVASLVNTLIRGLFRGKGKHSVDMGVNSVVLIADSGIAGAAQFEIVCLLSPDQIRELRKVTVVDKRILQFEVTDNAELMSGITDLGGFDFIGGSDAADDGVKLDDDKDAEIDVDAI